MNPTDDDRGILQARARALARPAGDKTPQGPRLDVVEFNLARERYAVEQRWVREVHPLKDLTPLPCTPPFLSGIINLRGQILPVIDIKKFFDLPEAGITDIHMVIIVRVEDVELGILADTVAGVRAVPLDGIQPSLPTLTGIRAAYLRGVTANQVVILDVPGMLADPKITVNEGIDL